jgi:hypothetical protein
MPIAPDRRLVRVARHVVLRAATLVEDAVRAAAKGLHRFYNSNDLTARRASRSSRSCRCSLPDAAAVAAGLGDRV